MIWSNLLATRDGLPEMAVDVQCVRTTAHVAASNQPIFWIDDGACGDFQDAGLTSFDAVMSLQRGRRLRKLADRENWHLPASRGSGEAGLYLKKHSVRTWATRLAALTGRQAPRSAGRIEAENALLLEGLGIPVMRVVGFGERLLPDGRQESFLLSSELAGYRELQDFIAARFPAATKPSWRHCELRRLIVQVAEIARKFHEAGYNHRDFYCCHLLVREIATGRFDVRLIDLQRVEHRTTMRRRWIVKDLAQLASMAPAGIIGDRARAIFLRHYLGLDSLRAADRNLLRRVASKEDAILKRVRRKS